MSIQTSLAGSSSDFEKIHIKFVKNVGRIMCENLCLVFNTGLDPVPIMQGSLKKSPDPSGSRNPVVLTARMPSRS